MKLTESYAMWPGAAVSGWYFSHPDTRYFAVAQIQDDQRDSYADRKAGIWLKLKNGWAKPIMLYR